MKYSIIIPYYGKFELVNDRLIDLHKRIPLDKFEVILIDDHSIQTDKTNYLLDQWLYESGMKIKTHRNPQNFGFGYSMNRGTELADNEMLVFLSNDVKVMTDFTIEIDMRTTQNNRMLFGAELLIRNTGWNTFDGITIPYLNGWFIACHKDIFNELGGFDHLSFGISDYEDIDLSANAIMHGISLVQLDCARNGLYHLGAQTAKYDDKRLERTNKNKETFYRKWRGSLQDLDGKRKNIRIG